MPCFVLVPTMGATHVAFALWFGPLFILLDAAECSA